MQKACLECGDNIVGRIDKKFCSDGCRNAYNNKVNKDSKNLIRNTNNIYYFVYDQGYLPLEGDYYALVKRDS